MDEFSAQSRDDNDLFSDDFEPAQESQTAFNGAAPEFRPDTILSSPQASHPSSRGQYNSNHRGGRGGRSGPDRQRGGRGASEQGGGLAASRYADPVPPKQAAATPQDTAPSSTNEQEKSAEKSPPPRADSTQPGQSTQDTQSPLLPALKPTENTASRPHAVRGDRSATGGPAQKKLTEEEMNEKLEKMKIIDAQRAERFRKSEADQAAFQQKEAELAKRRDDETKNRRAMDMERAKNRERKLRSQGGREWDESKTEADIVDRTKARKSEYVRGGHGGVISGSDGALADGSYASRRFLAEQGVNDGWRRGAAGGRGRGGRESRTKGTGRGTLDSRNVQTKDLRVTTDSSATSDFPPLPTTSRVATDSSKAPPTATIPAVATLQKDSTAVEWAEEMATPVEKAAEP